MKPTLSHTPALVLLVVFGGASCGGETPASSRRDDAGGTLEAPRAPAPPAVGDLADPNFVEAPRAPRLSGIVAAAPDPGPCPNGWAEIALDSGHRCEPPRARADCRPGEYADPAGDCRVFGRACASDGWPSDLPNGTPVLYVDPAAPAGGDGQRRAPLDSIVAAVGQAPDGAVIALRSGEHHGPVQLDRPVTLWGACAAETRLVAPPAEVQPNLRIRARVVVRDLTISGPRPGVYVGEEGAELSDADLRLESVAIANTVRQAIATWPGSRLAADALWVHGVAARPSNGVGGLFLQSEGSIVSVRRSVFEDGGRVGLLAIIGTDMTVEDSVVRRVRRDVDGLGLGAFVGDSRLTLTRSVVEAVYETGVFAVFDAEVDARQLAVRDVTAVDRDGPLGPALAVEQGGQIRLRGGSIEGSGPVTTVGLDPGSRIDLVDTYIGAVVRSAPSYTVAVLEGCALTAERVWIADEAGISVESPDSSAAIRDLTLRVPPGPRNVVDGAALFAGDGVRTMTATAVSVVGAPGVSMRGPDTRLEVRGLRVSGLADSTFAAFVNLRARLELAEAELDDASIYGIFVVDGSTLMAEDIVLRRPGIGIAGNRASRVEVARGRIERPSGGGVAIRGGDVRLEDVAVEGLTSRDIPEAAVHLTAGATASLSRLALTDLAGNGMHILDGTRVDADDVRMNSVMSIRLYDFGVYVEDDAVFDVERLSIRNYSAGAIIDGRAVVRDVFVTGRPLTDDGIGFGGPGHVELRRGRFVGVRGVALTARERGTLTAEDVVIEDVAPAGEVSVGVALGEDAEATIDRLRIRQARTAGLSAFGRSRSVLRDVRMSDGQALTCVDPSCGVGAVASGVFVQDDAAVDIERFELSRLETAGFLVRGGGVDAREGVVEQCGIGLISESADYDPGRATDRVVFRDNQRDVLTRSTSFPPVRLDPTPRPSPELPFGD